MDVVDAIVAAVPIPAGWVRVDHGTEPIDYAAKRLYGYPLPEEFAERGDGSLDQDNFVVALAITVPSNEADKKATSRSVSTALQNAVEAITDWVRAHRQLSGFWDDLQARVQWPGFRGFDYRAVRIDLTGYRFVS